MINENDVEMIEKMANKGRKSKIDMLIKDIYPKGISKLKPKDSISYFSKLKKPNRNDKALGIINLVSHSVGKMIKLAAYVTKTRSIVLVGKLSNMDLMTKKIIEKVKPFRVTIPKNSEYCAAIGAANA